MPVSRIVIAALALGAIAATTGFELRAQHDATPQAANTTGLEPLGEEWRKENPYRDNDLAKDIGAAAYNTNCARCHGLQAISGGLAPDLRQLEKGAVGDEWFMERIRNGAGAKMPGFEGVISQEAMWAIRTYVESQFAG